MKRTAILLVIILLRANMLFSQFILPKYVAGQRDTMDFTELYFVGTGDIQQNIAQTKDDIAASTGLGVIFWRMFGDKLGFLELQFEARINIASTVDTINAMYDGGRYVNMRDFGSYVLSPLVRGQATTVNTLWYFRDETPNSPKIYKWINGFQIDGIAANQIWADSTGSANTSVLGLRAGIFHEFVPTYHRLKEGYSIRLGVNWIVRGIRGDLGTSSETSVELRRSLLGSGDRIYHGPELALALKLKNLKAQANLPIILRKNSDPIPGLTGTQFITTISFIGGFPLKL